MTTLLLATGNPHKKREFTGILNGYSITTPDEIGIDFDFEEKGVTFFENAFGKAAALFASLPDARKTPVIADDSGLCVEALGGAPGIYSARYGSGSDGRKLDAPERNAYLLSKLEGVNDRRAYFVCCMVLLVGPQRYFVAQETWEGEIALKPAAASGGFGYDPVFYLRDKGKTVAELGEEEKNLISHRGKAALRIAAVLRTLL